MLLPRYKETLLAMTGTDHPVEDIPWWPRITDIQ
jgi:hypothetical protein